MSRPTSDVPTGRVRLRKRPIEVEMFVWDGTHMGTELARRWLANELGFTIRQVSTELLTSVVPATELHLWVAKGRTWAILHPGDAIAREADWSGYYPIAADVLAATFEVPA